MIRLVERSAPQRHDGVTDVLIEGALIAEDDARHFREVAIQQVGEFLSVERFRDGSEAAHVAEQDGDLGLSRLHPFRIGQQAPNHFGAHVLLEGPANFALFLFLNQDAIERNQADVGNKGKQRRNDEVQPRAVQKREVDDRRKR